MSGADLGLYEGGDSGQTTFSHPNLVRADQIWWPCKIGPAQPKMVQSRIYAHAIAASDVSPHSISV